MIFDEHRVSLGLHGTIPFRYHPFSHVLYGATARLLAVPVSTTYGLATSVIFVPLLFASLLALAGELRPLTTRVGFYGGVLLLMGFIAGFAGRPLMESCTLWQPYFVSQSYLVALIVFGLIGLGAALLLPAKVERA